MNPLTAIYDDKGFYSGSRARRARNIRSKIATARDHERFHARFLLLGSGRYVPRSR